MQLNDRKENLSLPHPRKVYTVITILENDRKGTRDNKKPCQNGAKDVYWKLMDYTRQSNVVEDADYQTDM